MSKRNQIRQIFTHALFSAIVAISNLACSGYARLDPASELSPARQSFTLLRSTLLKTDITISTLRFKTPCFVCSRGRVAIDDILPWGELSKIDGGAVYKIASLLAKENNFILELSKPCPSINPTIGLLIASKDSRMLLLLFHECGTARIISDDHKNHAILNIDPVQEELFRMLNK